MKRIDALKQMDGIGRNIIFKHKVRCTVQFYFDNDIALNETCVHASSRPKSNFDNECKPDDQINSITLSYFDLQFPKNWETPIFNRMKLRIRDINSTIESWDITKINLEDVLIRKFANNYSLTVNYLRCNVKYENMCMNNGPQENQVTIE